VQVQMLSLVAQLLLVPSFPFPFEYKTLLAPHLNVGKSVCLSQQLSILLESLEYPLTYPMLAVLHLTLIVQQFSSVIVSYMVVITRQYDEVNEQDGASLNAVLHVLLHLSQVPMVMSHLHIYSFLKRATITPLMRH